MNKCKEMLYVFFDCYLISSTYLYYREACTHVSDIYLTIKGYKNRIEVKNSIHSYIGRLTICIITTSGSSDSDCSD